MTIRRTGLVTRHRRPLPPRAPPDGPCERPRGDQSDDRGQASVELALCLPVVAVMVLGLLQVGLVVRDQLMVDLAAREGARHAAMSPDPQGAAVAAVDRVLGDHHGGVEVTVEVGERTVQVTVHAAPVGVPVMGALVSERRLSGRATMALEPQPP